MGRWYGSRYVNNGIYVVGNFEISRVSLEHVFSLPNLVLVDLRSGIEKRHKGSGKILHKILQIPPIKSKQINTIRLYGWPLSDKGVLDILKQVNSTLRSLDVGFTRVTGSMFSRLKSYNLSLTRLSLSGCKLTDSGLQDILKYIGENSPRLSRDLYTEISLLDLY